VEADEVARRYCLAAPELRRARRLDLREGRRVEGHLDPATRLPILLRQTAAARDSGRIVRFS
jgi:hypothetical protein